MKNIAIVGASGLGREVLVLLHQINEVQRTWNMIGFYDDDPALHGQSIHGFPCLGALSLVGFFPDELYLVLAVSDPAAKASIVQQIKNPVVRYATLVHPLAQPRPYQQVKLGEGTLVFQGAVFTAGSSVGRHTLVYLNCTIGHDSVIGDYTSLMPGATISGHTRLGQEVLVGANAVVLQGLHIGNRSKVGAGAVVTTSLPSNCTAVGIPAKVIRHHDV